MQKPNYPNMHRLAQVILSEGKYPGSEVISGLEADSYEHVPLVAWQGVNGGQYSYGLWNFTLVLNVICEPPDMNAMISHLYAQVHSWEHPGVGVIESEKFGVETVEDRIVFDTVQKAIVHGKHIVQFTGQFALTVQDWS